MNDNRAFSSPGQSASASRRFRTAQFTSVAALALLAATSTNRVESFSAKIHKNHRPGFEPSQHEQPGAGLTVISHMRLSHRRTVSSSSLQSTSETKSGIDSSIAATNTTVANQASVAKAERAWTLAPISAENDMSLMDAMADSELQSDETEISLMSKLTSADVLGPLFTIAFVIVFLCNTLLNSGEISDTFLAMDLHQKLNVLSKISWFPGQFQEAQLVVALVMAFSAFAQALTGFGFAVVAVGAMSSMPWLLHSELFGVITPVAATLGALVGFILLIPYAFTETVTEEEPGLEWDQILPLLIPCTVLTPVGIQLNNMVDPLLATRVLAALIMGFVGYKLVPTIQDALSSDESMADNEITSLVATEPEPTDGFLQSQTAAILFGSAAGIFGGAFDVQGPPLCVYGDAKGWSPARFRNNVLAVVCLNSALVVAIDAAQGSLGGFYYSYFCLTSLPGVLLGIVAGQWASERIDPVLFKNLVLVMCLGLGLQLLTVS
ncbi:unnamed protein product [Pseudo-nitzschia multistriata]|uniref:Membrane transporter protein n=1 Tax=Pseudo-nitzschia multistriata TaxID=183589 RepID=A0A448ZCU8_9STRA|nr:unnamed protein product [Pseudo-nitzschia multistriata]